MTLTPRTPRQRKQDALTQLDHEVDAWVATAGDDGPYLVPLSFLWDGDSLLFSTPAGSPTIRNLQANGRARLGIGPTRDLLLIHGTAQLQASSEIPPDIGDAFARKTGFDPRELSSPYTYFRIFPQRLQAWREANELTGRDLMRDGQWCVED